MRLEVTSGGPEWRGRPLPPRTNLPPPPRPPLLVRNRYGVSPVPPRYPRLLSHIQFCLHTAFNVMLCTVVMLRRLRTLACHSLSASLFFPTIRY